MIADVKGNTLESPTLTLPRLQFGAAVFTHAAGRLDAHELTLVWDTGAPVSVIRQDVPARRIST